MSTKGWMDKENVVNNEYYSPLQEKEILSYATRWMNFEDSKLSEITQPWKENYATILFIWGI